MEHTPGPWRIDKGEVWSLDRGQIRDANGYSIGNVPYTLGGAQDHANGLLIAASPDLLAACKAARDEVQFLSNYIPICHDESLRIAQETLDALDAAIAKAEGVT